MIQESKPGNGCCTPNAHGEKTQFFGFYFFWLFFLGNALEFNRGHPPETFASPRGTVHEEAHRLLFTSLFFLRFAATETQLTMNHDALWGEEGGLAVAYKLISLADLNYLYVLETVSRSFCAISRIIRTDLGRRLGTDV